MISLFHISRLICILTVLTEFVESMKILYCRQKGNEKFKQKKAQECHEFYTKSIALAESGSENLALAYANRSAILFDVGLYKECLHVSNFKNYKPYYYWSFTRISKKLCNTTTRTN